MSASAPFLEAEDVIRIPIEDQDWPEFSIRVAMEENSPPPSYVAACSSGMSESEDCGLLQKISYNENYAENSPTTNRKQLFESLSSSYETDLSNLKNRRSLPAFNAQEPQIRARYRQEFQTALENLAVDKSADAQAVTKFEEKLNDLRNIAALQVDQLEKVDAAVEIATAYFKRKMDFKMDVLRSSIKSTYKQSDRHFNMSEFTNVFDKVVEKAVVAAIKELASDQEETKLACRQAILEALTPCMSHYESQVKSWVAVYEKREKYCCGNFTYTRCKVYGALVFIILCLTVFRNFI